MIKRISCRVVSSVPLTKNSSESPHKDKLNKQYDTSDLAWDSQGHISISEPSTHTGRENIPLKSFEDTPVGLILDCYA